MFLSILASVIRFNVHGMVWQIYLQIMTHKCTSQNVGRNSVKTFKVEITPCSSFSLGGFSFVWWEKVLMDPKCD